MGIDTEEHLNNLKQVVRRLNRHGRRANVQKNEFLKDEIDFCGHGIDLRTAQNHRKCVGSFKCPSAKKRCIAEQKAFLRLVTTEASWKICYPILLHCITS